MDRLETSDVIAIKAGIRDRPVNADIGISALFDALQEAGATPLQARRRCNKMAAEARLLYWRKRRDADSAEIAKVLRKIVKVPKFKISIFAGDAAPALSGEGPYSTFKGSKGRCHSPGAAIRAGYKVEYHKSSYIVAVGCGWLEENVR